MKIFTHLNFLTFVLLILFFVGCSNKVGVTPFTSIEAPFSDGSNSIEKVDHKIHYEFLANVDSEIDHGELKLEQAWGVTTAEVSGETYLFTAGFADHGFSVFRVSNDGMLGNVTNVSDSSALALGGAREVAVEEVGGTTYLFVSANRGNGVGVFSIAGGGVVRSVHNKFDTGSVNDGNPKSLKLDGVRGLTTARIGEKHYLFAAGFRDDGVSVFRIENNGALADVTNVSDTADVPNALELHGAQGLTTAEVGGTTYLFVTGNLDDGISVFSVSSDGVLENRYNVPDDGTLVIGGASGVTTVKAGEETYLFVTGVDDHGFSVFRVANDGSLANVVNVSDKISLHSARKVTTRKVGDVTYLFVTAGSQFAPDGGNVIAIYRVGDGGSVEHVRTISDNDALTLRGAYGVATALVGENNYLFVTAYLENGVSVFSID